MDRVMGWVRRHARAVVLIGASVALVVWAPWPTITVLALGAASLGVFRVRNARHPAPSRALRARMVATSALLVLAASFFTIQFIPYGRSHENPAVAVEPAWDSPETAELARRACFDCHSNETHWPWYGSIAPISWWITAHVEQGRQALNFSETALTQEEAAQVVVSIRDGTMPPPDYVWIKPGAGLGEDEREALAAGIEATLLGSVP